MNLDFSRLPPHDLEAEMAVLASVLLEPPVLPLARAVVRDEDFYQGCHRDIFAACADVADDGKPGDVRLVVNHLERVHGAEAPDHRAWREVLATIAGAVATPANVEHYARIVRDKARARQALRVAAEVSRVAYDDEAAAVEVLRDGLERLEAGGTADETGALGDGLGEAVERLVARIDLERGEGGCLPWGIRELDDAGAFLRPGDFCVVAGMPGVGKSTWVLDWALRTATRIGPVLFVSLEMDVQQLREKVLLNAANVADPHGRGLDPESRRRLDAAAASLRAVPLLLPARPPSEVGALCSWLRDRIHRRRPVAVAIDYLGLAQGEGENATAQTADVSKRLRTVARQTGVPLVAVHSMNRSSGSERREPELRDLRQSGQIEFDATQVFFLWKPYDALDEKQRERTDFTPEQVWLLVRKARRGQGNLKVILRMDGARSRLLPLARGRA